MAVSRLFSVSLGPEIPTFLLMRKGNFASSIIASQLKLELSCQGAGRLQCWPKAGKGDGNAVRGGPGDVPQKTAIHICNQQESLLSQGITVPGQHIQYKGKSGE